MHSFNSLNQHPVIAFAATVLFALVAAAAVLCMEHGASAADTLLTDSDTLNSVL